MTPERSNDPAVQTLIEQLLPRRSTAMLGILPACGGVLGAAGIAMAAAAAHEGGGELASTAATFMVLHAVAIVAVTTSASQHPKAAPGLLLAAALMLIGTVAFSGDLAMLAFFDKRPFPGAAPFGGVTLIAGWLLGAASWIVASLRPE